MMKRYIPLLLFFSAVFSGCTKEPAESGESGPKNLEVTYTLDGTQVKSLPFNSSSRTFTLGVQLNNQNLWWDVESDSEWCKVFSEKHRGDGSVTITLTANKEYEDRTPATLTFVCGQFRGFELKVLQTGNVFVVDRLFTVSSKTGGSRDIEVSTLEGVTWNIVSDDWMTVTRGEPRTDNGVTLTTVSVSWEENLSSSRYGSVGFVREGFTEPDSKSDIYQFGTELQYDESGCLTLLSKDCPPLEIKVPSSVIKSVSCPDYVTVSSEDNPDNTTTYRLAFADNPSDTRTVRRPEISFDIIDKEIKAELPLICQEFYPVQGITSADGLKLFATTVNEGGDVSEWQKNGKVVLLNNIDMSQLTGEWISAGTQEHPFTGIFDGQYRKIQNLKTSDPLFGVCDGAALSNIIIDGSSSFTASEEYSTYCFLAPLAGTLIDCQVKECTNYAPVTMKASSLNESTFAFVSGLVCRSEGSTVISESLNYGQVEVTSESSTAFSQGRFYAGGIAAINEGTVERCTNEGAVSDAGVSYYHYLAGIVAHNSGKVESSVNKGAVTTSSIRVINGTTDVSRYISMGGIAGCNGASGSIVNSTNDASLISTSDVKIQRIGGVAGYLEGDSVSENINTANGKFEMKNSGTTYRGVRQLSLGGLYGEFVCNAQLDFTGQTNPSAGTITISDYEKSVNSGVICIGGLVGRTNLGYSLTVKNPSWNSTILLNVSGNESGGFNLGIGGVVGMAGVVEYVSGTELRLLGGHLAVEGAVMNGLISIKSNSSKVMQHKYAGIGGVCGFVSIGGATLRNCKSGMSILHPEYPAKSNGFAQHLGGIAGFIFGGISEIASCSNSADLDNEHYNNNQWLSAGLQSGSIGGIIGAYGYSGAYSIPADEYDLGITVSDCTNSGSLRSHRGMAGGIAGYLCNGSLSGCDNTGSMGNGNRSYVGGIIGVADDTSIENCTAVCNVGGGSGGSEVFSGGGIAGVLYGTSSCSDCAWFGKITSLTTTAGETAGGIAGSSASGIRISGCRLGGSVLGTEISESNYASYISGDAKASVTSCSYWNGK